MIERLEEYLAQFISRNKENGVTVHCAKDAAEAIQIVLQIAKDLPKKQLYAPWKPWHGKILIAKSRPMVSEEIKLKHALEPEGIQVVDHRRARSRARSSSSWWNDTERRFIE